MINPIHKFNDGEGATLCNRCRTIISKGHTQELYCDECKQVWYYGLTEAVLNLLEEKRETN